MIVASYTRARYYDPNLGRFISEDPLGFAGSGTNFHAYVGNHPVNNIDPSGLTTLTSTSWFPGATLNSGIYTMNVNDGQNVTQPLNIIAPDQLLLEEHKIAARLRGIEQKCGRNDRLDEAVFDTDWFGYGVRHYYWVQGINQIYADNEINYLGIGMYERWLGDSLSDAQTITRLWKLKYPGQPIPPGTWYWLQKGYDDYPVMVQGERPISWDCGCGSRSR
jgi:uncharacterized protein RhaS with RHS repeats